MEPYNNTQAATLTKAAALFIRIASAVWAVKVGVGLLYGNPVNLLFTTVNGSTTTGIAWLLIAVPIVVSATYWLDIALTNR